VLVTLAISVAMVFMAEVGATGFTLLVANAIVTRSAIAGNGYCRSGGGLGSGHVGCKAPTQGSAFTPMKMARLKSIGSGGFVGRGRLGDLEDGAGEGPKRYGARHA
jgi:hypothetical protein